jgi:DNA polymerase elongation subunit (family B)
MLLAFLDAIEDVDLLTGWSSSQYDIPYLINRTKRVLGIQATHRFCLWNQAPISREYRNKFGRMVTTYDLVGRQHLDYLELYAKHNPQQRLSYALNSIAQIEVGETKTPYSGTLDELYNNDFPKFIEYNRQDVMLMVKIDRKLKFIELANQIAHANCVLLKTTMGSVALVEQAIINEMHAMGAVVSDRKREEVAEVDFDPSDDDDETSEHSPVVGAYVAQPKKGLHDWIGCVDINSLYPSTIRALNMSPETLVGQVRLDETMRAVAERAKELPETKRAEAWDGIFETLEVSHMHAQDDTILTVDFFDMLADSVTTHQMTGKQLYELIYDPDNNLCITANGTIFRTDIEGMIPALLSKWFAERKNMQAKQRHFSELAACANDPATKAEYLALVDHWNRLQAAAKIRLNATYGTILNESFRMWDPRLGQSTTLSGRVIVRHMNAKINEVITGEYHYDGSAIIAADTDSSYFSAYRILKDDPVYANFEWQPENVIQLYDLIAEDANQSFSAFMAKTFNTNEMRSAIIRAGRELVAVKGLFVKKKKYAVLMIDKEGERLDVDGKPGKLKVMGLDLKRADTPKFMQDFLAALLLDLLRGVPQQQMFDNIKEFRRAFKARPGWEKGSPMKAANLSGYGKKAEQAYNRGTDFEVLLTKNEKLRVDIPWHVRAAMGWNLLCELNDDRYSMRITDSARVIVCKLKSNTYNMSTIAYPIDEIHLPTWFRELPFDDEAMEETIVDNKLTNLVGVLDWNLLETKERLGEQFFQW